MISLADLYLSPLGSERPYHTTTGVGRRYGLDNPEFYEDEDEGNSGGIPSAPRVVTMGDELDKLFHGRILLEHAFSQDSPYEQVHHGDHTSIPNQPNNRA